MYTFHGLNINRNIFVCLFVCVLPSVVCFSKAWFGLEEASIGTRVFGYFPSFRARHVCFAIFLFFSFMCKLTFIKTTNES